MESLGFDNIAYSSSFNKAQASSNTKLLNEKFIDYQNKFKNTYGKLKRSLGSINENIIDYKTNINKLEDFLVAMNDHETNYKTIQNKYSILQKNLEDTVEIEKIINQVCSHQQIINLNEYSELYKKVKKISYYFRESKYQDKDDFTENLNKLMFKGFKMYQDSFYVLLKRYEQISQSKEKDKDEEEKKNLLSKIEKLILCLQDEEIGYDFTSGLIKERTDKITPKIDEIKNQHNFEKNIIKKGYAKGTGKTVRILRDISDLLEKEEKYVLEIFGNSSEELKTKIISRIYNPVLQKIAANLKEMNKEHERYEGNTFIDFQYQFHQNLDLANIWIEKYKMIYETKFKKYSEDLVNDIFEEMKKIYDFCTTYIENIFKIISSLNNEKIETENVLNITNNTITFISNLLTYETAYKDISANSDQLLEPEDFIKILVDKLESRSLVLEKKYPPLKYLFLVNNVYFIKTRITSKEFEKIFKGELKEEDFGFDQKLKKYIKYYLTSSWSKIDNIFKEQEDEKEEILYAKDGGLTSVGKEIIKKKFSAFNETMKINSKFQQRLQIIDKYLENLIIAENINHVCDKYQAFYDKYKNLNFTKLKSKYIIYQGKEDVEQDLKLYFMGDNEM